MRVNISMSEQMLSNVDSAAAEFGMTRSSLICAALNDYISAKRKMPDVQVAINQFQDVLSSLSDYAAGKISADELSSKYDTLK